MNKKIINERLIKFRKEKGLSQREMAERLGVSQLTYSNVENGISRGSVMFWAKFKKVFDVNSNEIWHIIGVE